MEGQSWASGRKACRQWNLACVRVPALRPGLGAGDRQQLAGLAEQQERVAQITDTVHSGVAGLAPGMPPRCHSGAS